MVDDLVDQPVVHGLLAPQDVVAVDVGLTMRSRGWPVRSVRMSTMRSRMVTISRTAISMSTDWPCAPPWGWWIRMRALGSAERCPASPAASSTAAAERGLAHAHGVDGRAEELHGVVDGEQCGHVAAGRVDVQVHRPVHVLALEVQQLGDDQVGDLSSSAVPRNTMRSRSSRE